jgi:hypothetical protein
VDEVGDAFDRSNRSLGRDLSRRGNERAAGFRWSITAAKTLGLYDRLLSSRG